MITLAVQASGDRDHRDRDGADHRLAQHRPVGRVARRRHRDDLRPADDRLVPGHLRAQPGHPVPVGRSRSALGIGIGAAIGAFQGFIIAYIGVPSFIVTLGGLLAIRGVVWYLSQGAAVNGLDPTFLLIGGGPRARSARSSPGRSRSWSAWRSSASCSQRPAPAAAVRVPGAADVGRGRCSASSAARAVLGVVVVREQQLLAAGPRRTGSPRGELGAGARGRLADPDRVPAVRSSCSSA